MVIHQHRQDFMPHHVLPYPCGQLATHVGIFDNRFLGIPEKQIEGFRSNGFWYTGKRFQTAVGCLYGIARSKCCHRQCLQGTEQIHVSSLFIHQTLFLYLFISTTSFRVQDIGSIRRSHWIKPQQFSGNLHFATSYKFPIEHLWNIRFWAWYHCGLNTHVLQTDTCCNFGPTKA